MDNNFSGSTLSASWGTTDGPKWTTRGKENLLKTRTVSLFPSHHCSWEAVASAKALFSVAIMARLDEAEDEINKLSEMMSSGAAAC